MAKYHFYNGCSKSRTASAGYVMARIGFPELPQSQQCQDCAWLLVPAEVTISKEFKTFREAERYQDILYCKYDNVKLIMAPHFQETGKYIWFCKH
jgi:hypothetical protein